MRKVVIVLLIVVSLVASLSLTSSAYYLGHANGDFVPVPERIGFSTVTDWIEFSDSPFSLTDDTLTAIQSDGGISNYCELDFGEFYYYTMNTYDVFYVGDVLYLEYRVDFDGLETGGTFNLPIMNVSSLPLLYRVYSPVSDVVQTTVHGRGFNIVGEDITSELFVFTVYTDSESYINSDIAQMPLEYSALSDYDYVQLEIDFGAPNSLGTGYSILYPLDPDYNSLYHTVDFTDIDIEVIETPNFLNWLTRSVSAFLDTKIFTIGSTKVTLGVCLLVPLSLYFLVAFLKKFAGG